MQLGARQTMRKVAGGPLPYARELAWLYGVRGAYIDTGVAPLLWTDCIYVDATLEVGTWSGTDMFFGADTSNSAIACSPSGDSVYFKAFNTGSAPNFGLGRGGETRIELRYENQKVAVLRDGVPVAINNNVSPNAATSNPLANSIWIYKRHNASGSLAQRAHKLHRFRIVRGGADLLDIIPVVDREGVTCVYDRASGACLYTPTGVLTPGPDAAGSTRGGGVSLNA